MIYNKNMISITSIPYVTKRFSSSTKMLLASFYLNYRDLKWEFQHSENCLTNVLFVLSP